MDRVEFVNQLQELAMNIAENLCPDPRGLYEAIHEEIAANGTNSAYMSRGLDSETGEYDVNECMAHDLVDYALSPEGRDSWGIDMVLDAHDRELLIEFVTNALG